MLARARSMDTLEIATVEDAAEQEKPLWKMLEKHDLSVVPVSTDLWVGNVIY